MSAFSPYAELSCRLSRRLTAGQQEAARRGHSVLVSVTVDIPPVEPAVLFSRTLDHERILWEQPSQNLAMAAFGATARLTSSGVQRFAHISASWHGLVSGALVDAPSSCPLPPPVSLGGFAFDPRRHADPDWAGYPDGLLVIPRFLFLSWAGLSWLTVNVLVTSDGSSQATAEAALASLGRLQGEARAEMGEEAAGSMEIQHDEPQALRWKEHVLAIIRQIERGALDKLVLARTLKVSSPHPFDPGVVLHKLRAGYRHCTLFAFATRQSCFVGATPERLVRLEGRTVRTDCLAGSIRRGTSDGEDRALGQTLLADGKEQREHALVLRVLRNVLEPLCVRLRIPATPRLLRLPNVQHLHTPVEGVLKKVNDIFGLVSALHPTPATGGLPRETTSCLLRTYEDFNRGWYAGPVGWVDGLGGGEFVVAIRSALLRGRQARLYAGCGIVAGADPEREYRESCLKLRPMLWALNCTQS